MRSKEIERIIQADIIKMPKSKPSRFNAIQKKDCSNRDFRRLINFHNQAVWLILSQTLSPCYPMRLSLLSTLLPQV